MENTPATKYFKIRGRVQGVGFRYFTLQNARDLKLAGWVRNMPDGTVETVLSGPRDRVEEMVKRLKEGPRRANVTGIRELENIPDDTFVDFSIRR